MNNSSLVTFSVTMAAVDTTNSRNIHLDILV